jgi:hypothetical protein
MQAACQGYTGSSRLELLSCLTHRDLWNSPDVNARGRLHNHQGLDGSDHNPSLSSVRLSMTATVTATVATASALPQP